MKLELEYINNLFLELSQFTTAKTKKELELTEKLHLLKSAIEKHKAFSMKECVINDKPIYFQVDQELYKSLEDL